MSLKKSINAKDIMQSLDKKESIIEQPEQKEKNKQDKIISQEDLNHDFLSKIKQNQRKTRPRHANHSVSFQQNRQGHMIGMEQNQFKIQEQIQQRLNRTPTIVFQRHRKSKEKVGLNKRKMPFKVKRGVKSVKLTSPSVVRNFKQIRQASPLIITYPKTINLKPEINKTKIFQIPIQKLQIQNIKNTNLNAYQLSIKRKNINMLKMKLNGLGQKADMDEKKCCLQIDQIIRENQMRKTIKDKLRKLQIIRNKFQYKDKGKGSKVLVHSTQFNRQTYIIGAEENYDITSQTIQIRDVSKSRPENKNFVIHRKSLFDRSHNHRYNKNPEDNVDQPTQDQSHFHSLQIY